MRKLTLITMLVLAGGLRAMAQPAAPAAPADAPKAAAVSEADAARAQATFEEGRRLFFQGDFQGAIPKLQEAIRIDPRGGYKYKLLLAKAWRKANQPARAAVLLEEILKENPEHVEAGVALAELRAADGKTDEVIRILEPLLQFKHDYPLYHMLAEAYYQKSDLAKARDSYEEAVKLNPASGDDWYQLGNIYLAQSRFARAADAYEKASDRGVDSGVLHFKLASVYFNLRNYLGQVRTAEVRDGKVGQVVDEMLLIDPVPGREHTFYVAPARSAAWQIARARQMGIDVIQLRFLEANVWLNARSFAKADAIYAQLENKLPESDQGLFWFYWARTALGLDDLDAYLDRLGKAIKAEPEVYKPTLADAYVTVATRHQQRGEKDKYIEFLGKAVQTNPLSAGLHLTLADALWQMGRRDQAAEQYRLVLELEPDHGDRVRLLNRIREVEQTPKPEPEKREA